MMDVRVYFMPLLAITATIEAANKAKPSLAKAPFDAAAARRHQEEWARHLGQSVELKNTIGMEFSKS
jgi:hypothetical protein